MTTVSVHTRAAYALVLTVALVPVAASGAHAQELPDAAGLVERHVSAIGGREALLAKHSLAASGTFELPAAGLQGQFESAQSSDGSMVMKISVPGLGDIITGVDGGVGWALNPMLGPRLIDGAELAAALDEANFLTMLRAAPFVTALETVGVAEVNGERCYRVRVRWASGRQTHDCYAAGSGLLVATEMSQPSPRGTLDMITTYSEYREFSGVRLATVQILRAAGQDQVLRYESVRFDTVDPDAFTPPAPVAALLEERGGGSSR